jgi:hypothetical protein
MAVLDDLQAARTNVAARIAEITASPKPSYSLDGQSVSWESYLSTLTKQMQELNRLIQIEGGIVWLPTQAVT